MQMASKPLDPLTTKVQAPAETPNLEEQLETEKARSKTLSWTRLDRTEKVQRLAAFADRHVADKGLSDAAGAQLKEYLAMALRRQRLNRVRDVTIDKATGDITAIPALVYQGAGPSGRFTLRRSDKRQATSKGLSRSRKRPEPQPAPSTEDPN